MCLVLLFRVWLTKYLCGLHCSVYLRRTAGTLTHSIHLERSTDNSIRMCFCLCCPFVSVVADVVLIFYKVCQCYSSGEEADSILLQRSKQNV